jgi:hypothetical protein
LDIKIKRNSWHYWLWEKWYGYNEPQDLGNYILFQIFAWTLGWPLLVLLLLAVAGNLIYALFKKAVHCPAVQVVG